MATRVYLEVGQKRVFASSADWPGWSRSASRRARSHEDEAAEAALGALADYLPRYRAALAPAGLVVPADDEPLDVVERVTGDMTTDFGAPSTVPGIDHTPLPADEAARLGDVLEACWAFLDAVVAGAPASLRKGPRGGGRDRDAVVEHVVAAEAAYLRKLGVTAGARVPLERSRGLLVAALREGSRGASAASGVTATETFSLPAEGTAAWPVRYAVRRIAWHVLDHAWEIQDRSAP